MGKRYRITTVLALSVCALVCGCAKQAQSLTNDKARNCSKPQMTFGPELADLFRDHQPQEAKKTFHFASNGWEIAQ